MLISHCPKKLTMSECLTLFRHFLNNHHLLRRHTYLLIVYHANSYRKHTVDSSLRLLPTSSPMILPSLYQLGHLET